MGGEQAGYDAFGSTNHWGAIRETDNGQTILLDAWRNAHAVVTHPDGGDFTQDFNIFGLYWWVRPLGSSFAWWAGENEGRGDDVAGGVGGVAGTSRRCTRTRWPAMGPRCGCST